MQSDDVFGAQFFTLLIENLIFLFTVVAAVICQTMYHISAKLTNPRSSYSDLQLKI